MTVAAYSKARELLQVAKKHGLEVEPHKDGISLHFKIPDGAELVLKPLVEHIKFLRAGVYAVIGDRTMMRQLSDMSVRMTQLGYDPKQSPRVRYTALVMRDHLGEILREYEGIVAETV